MSAGRSSRWRSATDANGCALEISAVLLAYVAVNGSSPTPPPRDQTGRAPWWSRDATRSMHDSITAASASRSPYSPSGAAPSSTAFIFLVSAGSTASPAGACAETGGVSKALPVAPVLDSPLPQASRLISEIANKPSNCMANLPHDDLGGRAAKPPHGSDPRLLGYTHSARYAAETLLVPFDRTPHGCPGLERDRADRA